MASKIQVKRGNKADLPILSDGEYGFCQDTSEIFIGNGGTNTKIYPTTSLDASSVTVEDIESMFESVNVEGVLSELGESILDILNGVTTVGKASDANTVGGFTVAKNVPSNAIFTDTVVDISGKADIDQLHEHSNMPVLINISDNAGTLTYNGEEISGGSTYNDTTNAFLAGWEEGEYEDTIHIPYATDDDFTWVDTSEMGEGAPPSFYLYTGTKEIVKLPESINNTPLTSTSYMFMNGEPLGFSYTTVVKVILTHAKVTDMSYMFESSQATTLDLSSFDTSNVTTMSNMFYYCSSLTSLDLSTFDTSNVTSMSNMFSYCSGLTSLDLSTFDTSRVTNMSYMFRDCRGLTSLDLSSFDTSNVTDMSSMFQYCFSVTTAYARTQADADKFNASSFKPASLTFVVKP